MGCPHFSQKRTCVCVCVCVCLYILVSGCGVRWLFFAEREGLWSSSCGRDIQAERENPPKDELDPVAEHEKWMNVWNNTLREPIMALATRPWKEQLHLNLSSTFPPSFLSLSLIMLLFSFSLSPSASLINEWPAFALVSAF